MAIMFFCLSRRSKEKKRISPERWGFFLEQLITEIYQHQLECKSTVNTPRPRQRPPPPQAQGALPYLT